MPLQLTMMTLAAILLAGACTSDKVSDQPATDAQAKADAIPGFDIIRSFAANDLQAFLKAVSEFTHPQDSRAFAELRWLPATSTTPTGVQGATSHGITVYLDESTRKFVQNLFQAEEKGNLSPEQLSASIRVLDDLYASILSSHKDLNMPAVDQLQLSLTYAALGRAAMSQQAAKIGLENPPLNAEQVAAMVSAARYREYQAIDKIAP